MKLLQRTAWCGLAAVALAYGGAAQAQFIANGDLQSPAISTDTTQGLTGSGTATAIVPDWYAANGQTVTLVNTAGNQFLKLSAGEQVAAALSPNSFTGLSPGYLYDASFSYSGGTSNVNGLIGTWAVVIGADPFSGSVLQSVSLYQKGAFSDVPNPFQAQFTLPGTTNYPANDVWFRFTAAPGVTADSVTFNIDNVNAVPEPGSYALLLAGLAALGFVARRRAP
jgi:hypothetical protein